MGDQLCRNESMDNDHPEAGWTFVESIIVITIVLILTSAVGVMGMRYVDRARRTAAINEIATLALALDSYYLDTGSYPSTDQGLTALWTRPVRSPIPETWNGPYVSKNDFADPWNRPYVYRVPGPNGLPYSLISLGNDGAEGGEGNDEDILSWE